jgi:hypothetical protein
MFYPLYWPTIILAWLFFTTALIDRYRKCEGNGLGVFGRLRKLSIKEIVLCEFGQAGLVYSTFSVINYFVWRTAKSDWLEVLGPMVT